MAGGTTNTIATIEAIGLTKIALPSVKPKFSGTLAETGFSTRYGTWTVSGGALTGYGAESDTPTRLGTVYTDLCSSTECDLDHEALTQARVRVLLELPQATPHNESSSLGIGLEEGQGRRRGALAMLLPWKSVESNGVHRLNMFMYCGPSSSSVGPARLRSEGVNLDCSSRDDEVVDHTGQDYDFDLTGGGEYYVELEYRNLKLWARVWKKGEARPVLPQAGVRFTPEHFNNSISFTRNNDYVLNPTRLVFRTWGFTQASPLKIKEVRVTELFMGPKLGTRRGAASNRAVAANNAHGPTHHGRYSPVGRYVVDLPSYTADIAAGLLPVPVLSGSDARLVNVYDKAWELLYTRMRAPPASTNLVRTYIDEAFASWAIYQWDVLAMIWFAKYMHRSFETVGTLENFYASQNDDGGMARKLRETDGAWHGEDGEVNPPLFVEAELQAFRLTGDIDRIRRILPALREFIDWVSIVRWSQDSTHQLWWNDGGGSGLDNAPRPHGRGTDGGKVWGDPDMTAQLAHAYLGLGDLYELVGNDAQARLMRAYGAAIRTRLDEYMWKDFTGNSKDMGQWFYINQAGDHQDQPQVSNLWAMILGLDASDPDTADRKTRLRNILFDTEYYYTDMPLGTLPKSHSQFNPDGGYARGGLYPPTTYIGIKGAEKVLGFADGQVLAKRYLDGIADVFQYSDTIWEMYAPTRQVLTEITGTRGKAWHGISAVHNNGRATCTVRGSGFSCDILKTGYSAADLISDQGNGPYIAPNRRGENDSLVKPDFVGWGALGPIALLIENIIGIQANAPQREIVWYVTRTDRHGIENLWLGDGLGKFSLIAAARTDINQPISITAASTGATTSETSIRLRVVDVNHGCERTFDVILGQAGVSFTASCVPALLIRPPTLLGTEGRQYAYTVALATPPSATVTVAISGHAGSDLVLDNTSLTFSTTNWNTPQPVTIRVGEDTDTEPDSVTLTHSASGGDYGSVSKTLKVTITDNDSRGLDISQAALTVTEGDAAGQSYTVALTTQPSAAVTVTISGQASSDLVVDPPSLTFTTSNWGTAQTVTVTARDDADAITDEPVILTHRASGGDYGAVTRTLGVIIMRSTRPGWTSPRPPSRW